MSNRKSLDETYLEMTRVLSQRAACTRRQVGALVVDSYGRICASGYNGVPSGEVHCTDGGCPRGLMTKEQVPAYSSYENCKAIHAEANALLRAGDKARGGTIYVTDEPCHECARLIIASGIEKVVTPFNLKEHLDNP